jgi:hypothetical protein
MIKEVKEPTTKGSSTGSPTATKPEASHQTTKHSYQHKIYRSQTNKTQLISKYTKDYWPKNKEEASFLHSF